MLTSQQILAMIKAPSTGVSAGRAQYAASREARDTRGLRSHREFAEAMARLPVPQPVTTVRHPTDALRGQDRRHRELTPSDLVWLQRLPQNPADISFADATTLAAMAKGLAQHQPAGSSDRRLIDSIWRPVRKHYDVQVADAAVRNTEQRPPEIPSSALQALVDALRVELPPEFSDAEVVSRASETLSGALEERSVDHGMRAMAARMRADQVRTATDDDGPSDVEPLGVEPLGVDQ